MADTTPTVSTNDTAKSDPVIITPTNPVVVTGPTPAEVEKNIANRRRHERIFKFAILGILIIYMGLIVLSRIPKFRLAALTVLTGVYAIPTVVLVWALTRPCEGYGCIGKIVLLPLAPIFAFATLFTGYKLFNQIRASKSKE
jgi:hypothetical protein